MNIKDRRSLLREMDRRIITLLKARLDLASELDESILTELGVDPLSSADTDVSILTSYMRDMGIDEDLRQHIADFLVHYVR